MKTKLTKRVASLSAAATLALTLAACGGDDTEIETDTDDTTVETEDPGTYDDVLDQDTEDEETEE